MEDPKMVGAAFSADGAALHSKRDWYRLQFKCELTPDHKKVAAFEFLVGDPIPRTEWAEHSLPDEGRSLDWVVNVAGLGFLKTRAGWSGRRVAVRCIRRGSDVGKCK